MAPIPFRLSQAHLTLLTQCPRKFQHTFLDAIASLPTHEQQDRLDFGNQFHLLMQQRELQLPIHNLLNNQIDLQDCLSGFESNAQAVLQPSESTLLRESEHTRSLSRQGFAITVIYDLLILNENDALIIDWKTYPQPQNSRWLAHHWQTRLYRYVLAETSHYEPHQITMAYWFVQAGFTAQGQTEPQASSLHFPYNQALHAQTHTDVNQALRCLNDWLEDYEQGHLLPQVAAHSSQCLTCSFAGRCQRGEAAQNEQALTEAVHAGIDDIQELSL